MDNYLNKKIHIPVKDFFDISRYDKNKQLSIMNNYDISDDDGYVNGIVLSTIEVDGRTDLLCLTSDKIIIILTEEEVNKYI